METIETGTVFEKKFIVGEKDTARELGSGGLDVLATPRLVAWMENTAFEGLEAEMDENQTSVGTMIELSHQAATPVGGEVIVRATLISQERRAFEFVVEAFDETEKVGEAKHQRFMVDIERFMKKANGKRS